METLGLHFQLPMHVNAFQLTVYHFFCLGVMPDIMHIFDLALTVDCILSALILWSQPGKLVAKRMADVHLLMWNFCWEGVLYSGMVSQGSKSCWNWRLPTKHIAGKLQSKQEHRISCSPRRNWCLQKKQSILLSAKKLLCYIKKKIWLIGI